MHAWDIVQNAKTINSFEEATSGFDELIATTAKQSTDKNTTRAYLTPRELAESQANGNYALVFGRESRGLTSEELRKCDIVVHIEGSDYPVLNISHAAAIIFYELFSSKSSTKKKTASTKKAKAKSKTKTVKSASSSAAKKPRARKKAASTKKATTARKSTKRKTSAGAAPVVLREEEIAEVAYFLYEKRVAEGSSGDPISDWHAARRRLSEKAKD